MEGGEEHEIAHLCPSPCGVGELPLTLRICLALSPVTFHPHPRICTEAAEGPALSAELSGTEPYILSGPKPQPGKADCPLAWAVSRCKPPRLLVLNLEAKAEATLHTSLLLHCCLTAQKLRLISIKCFTYLSPLLEAPCSTPLSFLASCSLFYYTEDKIYYQGSLCSCFSHPYCLLHLCMYLGCVCMRACALGHTHTFLYTCSNVTACIWRSEDILPGSVLSSSSVGPRDRIQVVGLGSNHLDLLSHFGDPTQCLSILLPTLTT